MTTRRIASLLVLVAGCVAASTAPAATAGPRALPREYYQVSIAVPGTLSADLSGLWRITPSSEVTTVAGRRTLAVWDNTSFGGPSLTVPRAVAVARNASMPDMTAVIDRPLTAAESRTLAARPLYVDADVLVASRRSPLCTTGVTSDVARRLTSGEITDFAGAGFPDASWTGGFAPQLQTFAPTVGRTPAQSHFGAATVGANVYRLAEADMAARAAQYEGTVAIARYSGVRLSMVDDACLVPVDGVAPSDATLRDHSYAPSWTVSWIYKKRVDAVTARYRAAFVRHLAGARGTKYLTSGTTRRHLLPM